MLDIGHSKEDATTCRTSAVGHSLLDIGHSKEGIKTGKTSAVGHSLLDIGHSKEGTTTGKTSAVGHSLLDIGHSKEDIKTGNLSSLISHFSPMTFVQRFEVNPFSENTYIVYDASGECLILDPGCYTAAERAQLQQFIAEKNLRPVRLVNTHGHLDHVFGNQFVAQTWELGLEIHRGELPTLERYPIACQMYGIPNAAPSPAPMHFIEAGDVLEFGHTKLLALYTPGHSPASLSFYCAESGFVLAGDVLFLESVGRTDLPGGNPSVLEQSIRTQLFTLPGETIVYPGHGPETTIRHEKEYNPFLR